MRLNLLTFRDGGSNRVKQNMKILDKLHYVLLSTVCVTSSTFLDIFSFADMSLPSRHFSSSDEAAIPSSVLTSVLSDPSSDPTSLTASVFLSRLAAHSVSIVLAFSTSLSSFIFSNNRNYLF